MRRGRGGGENIPPEKFGRIERIYIFYKGNKNLNLPTHHFLLIVRAI